MASTGESYDDVGKLYSLSSNTQSHKMPLPGRSNRTFVLDGPNDPISDRRVPARQMERLPMMAIRFDDRLPLAKFKSGIGCQPMQPPITLLEIFRLPIRDLIDPYSDLLHVLVADCITRIPTGEHRNGIFVWDVADHNMSRHRGPTRRRLWILTQLHCMRQIFIGESKILSSTF